MTKPRFLPARDYLALKSAFARLVEQAGGQSAAARIVRVGQQQVSNYCSLAEEQAECFAPLDVVADLEAEVTGRGGRPPVAEQLAELAGYALERRGASGGAGLLALFGSVTAATTRAVARIAEDLADGTVDPAEARAQRAALAALKDAVERFDLVLGAIEAGPGGAVSVLQPRAGAANGPEEDRQSAVGRSGEFRR